MRTLSCGLCDLRAIAGSSGDQDLIGKTALVTGLTDLLGILAGVVIFSCCGIDDEQMLHAVSPQKYIYALHCSLPL